MKKKAVLFFLATITSASILFTGCGNKETETSPVTEETIEEVEPKEVYSTNKAQEKTEEPIEETQKIIGSVAITKEEKDAIKSNASDEMINAIEIYESITEGTGYYNQSTGETYTEVYGSPYDTTWRRMTDEEAQEILDNGETESGDRDGKKSYKAAQAELANGAWQYELNGIVYFDFYAYKKDLASHIQKWDIIAELDGFTPKSEGQIEQMGLTGTELESFIRTYWEKGMDMLAEMEVEELQSIRDQLVKAYEDNYSRIVYSGD